MQPFTRTRQNSCLKCGRKISYVINQTRKSVFDYISKHDSKSGQTPYMLRLFDIFSQSKLKLRSKWGNKIVKSMLTKISKHPTDMI